MYLVKSETMKVQAAAECEGDSWHQRILESMWLGKLQSLMVEGWRCWMALRTRERVREAKRQMFIVETMALGPKQRMVLMKCGDARFLVGTGPEGVTSVTRVDPTVSPSEVFEPQNVALHSIDSTSDQQRG